MSQVKRVYQIIYDRYERTYDQYQQARCNPMRYARDEEEALGIKLKAYEEVMDLLEVAEVLK